MASIVELRYNPFIPRLNILIDGQHPSGFSQLIQYVDEDIFEWCFCIGDTIYSEIRDDYVIVFTGTDSDASIMQVAVKKNLHCKSFKHIHFAIDTAVNQRMIALQKYIVTNNINQYAINRIGYKLIIDNGIEIDELLIKSKMNITNRFCVISDANSECSSIYNFIIVESPQKGRLMITKDTNTRYSFIIVIGNQNELLDIDENCIIYSAKKENIIQTIFTCLLSFPLTVALRNTYNSINIKESPVDLQLSVAVDPVVKAKLDSNPELGGTAKLITKFYPDNLQSPNLIYKIQNDAIASCNGLYVLGKAVGKTKLEIYKIGETIPVDIIDIDVIKRNRIKDLFLSQEQLILGRGDNTSLSVDYSPKDADNVETIKWESTNENVIHVSNGEIQAIGVGNCRVICTAENVSAQCICTVKEYLQDIIIQPFFDNNIIELNPMEEIELSLVNVPDDSIDGKLFILSSNTDIVNHIGTKIIGKKPGSAQLQIYNSSKTVVKTFFVSVVAPKNKSGFLHKIKQLIGMEDSQ